MPLSLSKMYKVTPANIRANSKAAVIQVRKRGQPKKYARLGDTFEIVYKVKCTKEWRNVTLRFLPKGKEIPSPSLSQPVWVRCTCPWFLYNCEYALSKQGSSWVHFSNGDPANQTNPRNIPFVCKHIYALQSTIKKFDPQTTPFREPKKKVLPPNTFKKLQEQEEKITDKVTPEPEAPTLTRQQQRVKDETVEGLEEALDTSSEQEAPKSVTDRVKKTLKEIIDNVADSDEPVADATVRQLKRVLNELKDEGTKALTNNRIVNNLNSLLKKFRGF